MSSQPLRVWTTSSCADGPGVGCRADMVPARDRSAIRPADVSQRQAQPGGLPAPPVWQRCRYGRPAETEREQPPSGASPSFGRSCCPAPRTIHMRISSNSVAIRCWPARLLVEVERRIGVVDSGCRLPRAGNHPGRPRARWSIGDRRVSGAGVPDSAVRQPPPVLRLPRSVQFDECASPVDACFERDYRVHPLVLPLLLGPIGPSLTVDEMTERLASRNPHGSTRRTVPADRLLVRRIADLRTGRLLHADGEQVAWLGLLDTPTPAAARQSMRKRKSPSARMARLAGDRMVESDQLNYGTQPALVDAREADRAGLARRRPGEQFDIRHASQIMRGRTSTAMTCR